MSLSYCPQVPVWRPRRGHLHRDGRVREVHDEEHRALPLLLLRAALHQEDVRRDGALAGLPGDPVGRDGLHHPAQGQHQVEEDLEKEEDVIYILYVPAVWWPPASPG